MMTTSDSFVLEMIALLRAVRADWKQDEGSPTTRFSDQSLDEAQARVLIRRIRNVTAHEAVRRIGYEAIQPTTPVEHVPVYESAARIVARLDDPDLPADDWRWHA